MPRGSRIPFFICREARKGSLFYHPPEQSFAEEEKEELIDEILKKLYRARNHGD